MATESQNALSCIRIKGELQESILFKKCYELWKENLLCDLKVVTSDRMFHCHSVVIVAYSKYFETELFKLTPGQQNIAFTEIDVSKLCSGNVFEHMLDFMYTGNVLIPIDLIETFLKESSEFQIDSLIQAIDYAFNPDIVDGGNVIKLTQISYKVNITSLKEYCMVYLCKDFQEISRSKDFLELSNEVVKDIVKRDDVLVKTEEEILDAVLLWTAHWPAERCNHLVDILKTLRLGFLPVSVLGKLIRHPLIRMNKDTLDFAAELIDYLTSNKEISPSFPANINPRVKLVNLKIVILGGCNDDNSIIDNDDNTIIDNDDNSIIDNVEALDLRNKSMQTLASLPEKLSNACTSVVDDELYVIGGTRQNACPTNSVYCYNPIRNTWIEKKSMNDCRDYHGVISISSKIYAIGGYATESIESFTNTVECYDTITDTWHSLSAIPKPLSSPAVCSSKSGKYIFSFGGRSANHIIRDIYTFNVFTDTWSQGGMLPESLCSACAVTTSSDRTFILGGWKELHRDSDYIFEYFPDEKIVTQHKKMPRERSRHSAFTVDNFFIYVLGGGNLDSAYIIDVYDINNDTWSTFGQLDQKKRNFSVSVLKF